MNKILVHCTLLFFVVIDVVFGENGLVEFSEDDGIFNQDEPALKSEVMESKIHHHRSYKGERIHDMRADQLCRPLRKNSGKRMKCQEMGKFPIQNECRSFLICLKKDVNPIFSCCPVGLRFDHLKRTCTEQKEARCYNVCQEKGIRYADLINPRRYLECSNLGIPESFPCPEGKDFNDETKECETIESDEDSEDAVIAAEFDEAFRRSFGRPPFEIFKEDDVSNERNSTPATPTPVATMKNNGEPIQIVNLDLGDGDEEAVEDVAGKSPFLSNEIRYQKRRLRKRYAKEPVYDDDSVEPPEEEPEATSTDKKDEEKEEEEEESSWFEVDSFIKPIKRLFGLGGKDEKKKKKKKAPVQDYDK